MSEYKAVKNYVHNELNLTRADIKEILHEVVREEVQKMKFGSLGYDLEDFIANIIIERCGFKERYSGQYFVELKNKVEKAVERTIDAYIVATAKKQLRFSVNVETEKKKYTDQKEVMNNGRARN